MCNVASSVGTAELESFFASGGAQCEVVRPEYELGDLVHYAVAVTLEEREKMLRLSGMGVGGKVRASFVLFFLLAFECLLDRYSCRWLSL